jgi:uncharacterized protein
MDPTQIDIQNPDLDALDAFLSSDHAPDDGMALSDLDGFLTAIVVGPETIPPSEWLPKVWGGGSPGFADIDEAKLVLGAVLGRQNDIARALAEDPPVCEPIFWETAAGDPIAGDWAEGFLEGMLLRLDAWQPLFMDKHASDLLFPILALCGDEIGESLFGLDSEFETQMAAEAPDLIPSCVVLIHRYWKPRRRENAFARRLGRKIGRNDSCPCGSGRKFKRCCGGG